jgi:hypothetical protein
MFDIAGKTSLRAAEDADLYEAFFYLASLNALESAKGK